jgi:hypothetical protein
MASPCGDVAAGTLRARASDTRPTNSNKQAMAARAARTAVTRDSGPGALPQDITEPM